MSKDYGIIIGIDPSGAFTEGKGTTGWCVMDAHQNKIIKFGCIEARKYTTKEYYWDEHVNLFIRLAKKYRTKVMIVIEDYLLYASTAEAQINSRFETSKLIGVLQYMFSMKGIKFTMQRAVDVKSRWTNEILEYKKIIKRKGNKYYIDDELVNRHILDSIRHVTHFNAFKNGKE